MLDVDWGTANLFLALPGFGPLFVTSINFGRPMKECLEAEFSLRMGLDKQPSEMLWVEDSRWRQTGGWTGWHLQNSLGSLPFGRLIPVPAAPS